VVLVEFPLIVVHRLELLWMNHQAILLVEFPLVVVYRLELLWMNYQAILLVEFPRLEPAPPAWGEGVGT
jgi:hypothetical protein